MKHALALLLLSCVLVAQDKPAAEAPKPAAVAPDPFAKIVGDFEAGEMRRKKLLQAPINVRDELIELIHQLKEEANESPITEYVARAKAKNEAQRLLLQALLELAKLPAESPLHIHSSSAELKDAPLKRGPRTR
jgi:hypothetical protein